MSTLLGGPTEIERPHGPNGRTETSDMVNLGSQAFRIGFLAPISIVTVVAAAVVSVLMEDRPCCTRGLLQATSFVFAECPQFEERGT